MRITCAYLDVSGYSMRFQRKVRTFPRQCDPKFSSSIRCASFFLDSWNCEGESNWPFCHRLLLIQTDLSPLHRSNGACGCNLMGDCRQSFRAPINCQFYNTFSMISAFDLCQQQNVVSALLHPPTQKGQRPPLRAWKRPVRYLFSSLDSNLQREQKGSST